MSSISGDNLFNKSIFIREKNNCELESKLENGLTLQIHLVFEKNIDNNMWQLGGNAELITEDLSQGSLKAVISPRILETGKGIFLGGMQDIYEKEGRTINISPQIPVGLLANLANENILKVSPARNGLSISSEILEGRFQELSS